MLQNCRVYELASIILGCNLGNYSSTTKLSAISIFPFSALISPRRQLVYLHKCCRFHRARSHQSTISWKSKNMKNLKSKFLLVVTKLARSSALIYFPESQSIYPTKILSTELYGNGRNTFCRIYMRQNWLCLRSLRQSIIFFMFSSWRLLVCRYEPVMYSQFEVTAAYSQKLLKCFVWNVKKHWPCRSLRRYHGVFD